MLAALLKLFLHVCYSSLGNFKFMSFSNFFRFFILTISLLAPVTNLVAEDATKLPSLEVIAETGDSLTPTYEQQMQRFLRRPGAETVISTEKFDSSHLGTLENLMASTPGVYSVARGNQNSGLYSIRGTDIATSGPRNGRGIRAYIDGVPLGRTEAGLTVSLIDILAADYVEVYRGANSLRFGAIASGGAFNFVSRTGLNNPGTRISAELGSFDFQQKQFQHGAADGALDYYISISDNRTSGYRDHTQTNARRLSSNLGWVINDDLETRFFFTIGKDHQESANGIPLNLIDQVGRQASFGHNRAEDLDYDRNFDYVRFANRTDLILDGGQKIAFDSFILYTDFDHLPYNAIVDNLWREAGIGVRYDDVIELSGISTEVTGGIRASYTDGRFKRFQHRNGGHDKGRKVDDNHFTSLLIEAYGETAFLLNEQTRLFLGLQYVNVSRKLKDNFQDFVLGVRNPNSTGGPQQGSTTDDEGYDVDYHTFNPKLGLNFEFIEDLFLFTSLSRSYEVPTASDVSDVVSNNADASVIDPQSAWTYEVGVRGGDDDLFVDLTLYYSKIKDEILTRCDNSTNCTDTIAFNADKTLHSGIELGIGYTLANNWLSQGDRIKVNTTWNHNNFKFDDDEIFGSQRLPVIPKNNVFTSLNYTHASGFYTELEYRYASKRGATYDGSGGDGWEIPSYETWGLLAGYKPKGKPYSFYLQGTNLSDERYVSTFTAEPTQPVRRRGMSFVPQEYVNVRVANGRALYAGFTYQFD